jgi:copper homeostasis protein
VGGARGRKLAAMTTAPASLEVSVTSAQSAVAAERGGAARVELCSGLLEGGVTPSVGLIAETRARIRIGLHVLIRPRGGDFLYAPEELAVLERDVAEARALGADGVVLGVLDVEGRVDRERLGALVARARPMSVTFHRAFDMARDRLQALEDLVAVGVDRVLTSGGERTAEAGAAALGALVRAAGPRLAIMGGGGVRAHNVRRLCAQTGLRDVHAGLEEAVPSPMRHRNERIAMGAAADREYTRFVVQEETVRAFVRALNEPA